MTKKKQTPNSDSSSMPTLPLQVRAQYIKDLSFENPNPIEVMSSEAKQPDLNVNIDVGANNIDGRNFEVTLSVQASAKVGDKTAFIVELTYAGIFELANEVPEEHFGPLLLIEAPRILFPFVRGIISDVTRDGGYPPLALAPIDFSALYVQQLQKSQAEQKKDDSKQSSKDKKSAKK